MKIIGFKDSEELSKRHKWILKNLIHSGRKLVKRHKRISTNPDKAKKRLIRSIDQLTRSLEIVDDNGKPITVETLKTYEKDELLYTFEASLDKMEERAK